MTLAVDHLAQPAHKLLDLASTREGVYCWLEVGSDPVKIAVFRLLAEDYEKDGGKWEADLNSDETLTQLQATMWSLVSGGVKEGEDYSVAMSREMEQEINFSLLPQALLADARLPLTRTLQDRRQKGLVVINGHGFSYRPQPRELDQIIYDSKRRGQSVAIETPNELLHSSQYQLRPFFQSVLKVMAPDYV